MKITKNELDERVKLLIKKFNKLQNYYLKKSNYLLKEIFDLRRRQNKNYTVLNLENEKGLEHHKDKIRSLMRFDDVTEYVSELHKEGKLDNSSVFLIANLPKEIQDNESQKKIADLIVKKEVNKEDLIGDKNIHTLMKKVNEKKLTKYEEGVLFKTLRLIKEVSVLVIDHKEMFSRQKNIDRLRQNLNRLNNILYDLQ